MSQAGERPRPSYVPGLQVCFCFHFETLCKDPDSLTGLPDVVQLFEPHRPNRKIWFKTVSLSSCRVTSHVAWRPLSEVQANKDHSELASGRVCFRP